ncbi:unnamed protein product [Schistosoma haematobium]|nr:unnamed protein product [Schistosoma haematobium]
MIVVRLLSKFCAHFVYNANGSIRYTSSPRFTNRTSSNVACNSEFKKCGKHNANFSFVSIMDGMIESNSNNNNNVDTGLQMVSYWQSFQIDRNKLLECLCNSAK